MFKPSRLSDGTIARIAGILELVGVGAVTLNPEHQWIGWIFIGLGGLLFLELLARWTQSWGWLQRIHQRARRVPSITSSQFWLTSRTIVDRLQCFIVRLLPRALLTVQHHDAAPSSTVKDDGSTSSDAIYLLLDFAMDWVISTAEQYLSLISGLLARNEDPHQSLIIRRHTMKMRHEHTTGNELYVLIHDPDRCNRVSLEEIERVTCNYRYSVGALHDELDATVRGLRKRGQLTETDNAAIRALEEQNEKLTREFRKIARRRFYTKLYDPSPGALFHRWVPRLTDIKRGSVLGRNVTKIGREG
jgi:hypothetical protein